MPTRLSDSEIKSGLADLPGWQQHGDHIERDFEFKDFAGALEFVNSVGAEAERMDHHPDIFLHDWNKVKITVSTHSAKGITKNDIELAGKVNLLKP